MSGWHRHSGKALLLSLTDVDTDQIIPARFMSQPRDQGYGSFLFYDIRRSHANELCSSFVLNQHPDTSILICGDNFGVGSSREAAAYALLDAGIKVVVAPGFGEIFAANAVNNGLLPARISQQDKSSLEHAMHNHTLHCVIDLHSGTISFDGGELGFELNVAWRDKLINGWDDIDLTMQHTNTISAFKKQRKEIHAWVWPEYGG